MIEARKWLHRAAAQGNSDAEHLPGELEPQHRDLKWERFLHQPNPVEQGKSTSEPNRSTGRRRAVVPELDLLTIFVHQASTKGTPIPFTHRVQSSLSLANTKTRILSDEEGACAGKPFVSYEDVLRECMNVA